MDIKRLRKTARLTQIELAQRAGLNRLKLSLAECGYVELTPKEQSVLAQAALGAAEARTAEIRKEVALAG